jgi:hypothetical protein
VLVLTGAFLGPRDSRDLVVQISGSEMFRTPTGALVALTGASLALDGALLAVALNGDLLAPRYSRSWVTRISGWVAVVDFPWAPVLLAPKVVPKLFLDPKSSSRVLLLYIS